MIPSIGVAEAALEEACVMNPGPWTDHSRHVAAACSLIAAHCDDLDPDKAYVLGLLHDIGRRYGVSSERHLMDGYRYCMTRGWDEVAKVCITHAFMIQDIDTSIGVFDMDDEDRLFRKRFVENASYDEYDRLVQLCDAITMPEGFCILEKRFVDVALRYGLSGHLLDRWRCTLALKSRFDRKAGISVYRLLDGIEETTFS